MTNSSSSVETSMKTPSMSPKQSPQRQSLQQPLISSINQDRYLKLTWTDFFVQFLILKRRSLNEFRVLLSLTLLLNLFAIIGELIDIICVDGISLAYKILGIFAVSFAIPNVILIVMMIMKPTATLALWSCFIIILLEVIYVSQIVVFYIYHPSINALLVLNILFIVFQVLTAIILYRFWEFVYFSYDDDAMSSVSNVSSLRDSMQDIQQSQVMKDRIDTIM